jgi:hypothetical protein
MTESLLTGAGHAASREAAMSQSTLSENARLIGPSTSRSIGAKRRRVVLAAAVGNTLEWYDFLVYGLLAPPSVGRAPKRERLTDGGHDGCSPYRRQTFLEARRRGGAVHRRALHALCRRRHAVGGILQC